MSTKKIKNAPPLVEAVPRPACKRTLQNAILAGLSFADGGYCGSCRL